MRKDSHERVTVFVGLLVALLHFSSAFGQLHEWPIPHHSVVQGKKHSAQRIASLQTVFLPFWDDFSYTDTLAYPSEDLWVYGKSVHLNSGEGIQPPSKNVITFDGIDSVGKPYNVNDILAKGLADKVESQNIRMDLVLPPSRSSVFLSFQYQVKGHGESPDPGDQLITSFKKSDGKWVPVDTIDNDGSLDPSLFYQKFIPVDSDSYYHDNFQFRIQNFARLSGPYDNWNVDYIYLNEGRTDTDTSFPDRTVSSPMTSLFRDYYAIPARHFLKDAASNLKHPSLELYNLSVGNTQPFDYTTTARFFTRISGSVTESSVPLDVAQDPGTLLNGLQHLTLTLNTIPPVSAFDAAADSIGIELLYGMSTKDNKTIATGGDYDPLKYSPIDFRLNDTIRTRYTLASYYAYDDGGAEYGAGLNQAGSYLAMSFTQTQTDPDTLVYVDIYFPEFGDNTAQSLLLQVRNQLDDTQASILYQQQIQVERKSNNEFARYHLLDPVIVGQNYYISWKQITNASIPVGLDKNNDNGSKIYYNTNGVWVQNTTVAGSLMLRPGYGRGNGGTVTGLESSFQRAYPNPANGICYLRPDAQNLIVTDLQGRPVSVELHDEPDRKAVLFPPSMTGLVILCYQVNGKQFREKLILQR